MPDERRLDELKDIGCICRVSGTGVLHEMQESRVVVTSRRVRCGIGRILLNLKALVVRTVSLQNQKEKRPRLL